MLHIKISTMLLRNNIDGPSNTFHNIEQAIRMELS